MAELIPVIAEVEVLCLDTAEPEHTSFFHSDVLATAEVGTVTDFSTPLSPDLKISYTTRTPLEPERTLLRFHSQLETDLNYCLKKVKLNLAILLHQMRRSRGTGSWATRKLLEDTLIPKQQTLLSKWNGLAARLRSEIQKARFQICYSAPRLYASKIGDMRSLMNAILGMGGFGLRYMEVAGERIEHHRIELSCPDRNGPHRRLYLELREFLFRRGIMFAEFENGTEFLHIPDRRRSSGGIGYMWHYQKVDLEEYYA